MGWKKVKKEEDIKRARGYLIVLDFKNSNLAHKAHVNQNGRYVIK